MVRGQIWGHSTRSSWRPQAVVHKTFTFIYPYLTSLTSLTTKHSSLSRVICPPMKRPLAANLAFDPSPTPNISHPPPYIQRCRILLATNPQALNHLNSISTRLFKACRNLTVVTLNRLNSASQHSIRISVAVAEKHRMDLRTLGCTSKHSMSFTPR